MKILRRAAVGGALTLALLGLSTATAQTDTGLNMSAGVASADEGRSFPGCPLLLENKSSGPCVEKLQNELKKVNPAHNLTVTKTFDAPTRIAVLDFQGRNHLDADGNVGSVTADELQRQYDAIVNEAQPPVQPGAPTAPAQDEPPNIPNPSIPPGGPFPNPKDPAVWEPEGIIVNIGKYEAVYKKDGAGATYWFTRAATAMLDEDNFVFRSTPEDKAKSCASVNFSSLADRSTEICVVALAQRQLFQDKTKQANEENACLRVKVLADIPVGFESDNGRLCMD